VINEEMRLQVEAFRALLNTPEWNDAIVQRLQKFKDTDTLVLTQVRKAGAEPSDDYLRGRIGVYNWLLTGLAEYIAEFDRNAARYAEAQAEVFDDGLPDGKGEPYSE
jgi:hypothetical protein